MNILTNLFLFLLLTFAIPYICVTIYRICRCTPAITISKVEIVQVFATDKPILPKSMSKPPPIAIPTVILAVINVLIWSTVQILYQLDYLPYNLCLAIWCINVYVAFTPLHEASHGSIATTHSGYRFLNGLIGRICAFIFVATYPSFRYVHLQHHKFTNIPSHDPDYWACSGPWFILPLKWFLQIYKYNYVYLWNLRSQPMYDVVEYVLFLIIPDIIGRRYNIGDQIFLQWILPSWIASTYLVFVFDYIPHRAHKNDDLFVGTNVTSLYGDTETYKKEKYRKDMIDKLTVPFLYQNYHNIHHLYPWIPFYKYADIWYKFDEFLINKGTKIRPLLPIF